MQDQWELITIAPIACKQSALTNRQVVTKSSAHNTIAMHPVHAFREAIEGAASWALL